MYQFTIGAQKFVFSSLKELMAKASPRRSADELAEIAAESEAERAAAQSALADVPLREFLNDVFIPYESDEVTRLILDQHNLSAFSTISSKTVGELRDWLLADETDRDHIALVRDGITPEMAAAVSKIMRLQDLIAVARKIEVITKFRNTIGLQGRISTRLQPNHPTDDAKGILVSIVDGLLLGSGDAVIGINPATDNTHNVCELLKMIDALRLKYEIPAQSCVLSHVTTSLRCMEMGAPVDLVFQSIAGSEKANQAFGVNLAVLKEAEEAALSFKRGTVGNNVMYFETGQGSALSSDAHFGIDAQTIEARAYAVAKAYSPLLVNTVVGFIGPEYLYNGKQIIRAGLEDHFCAKLLGLPMGCDVCYTNHAEADQDDMDNLLTLLGTAGCTYIMGVPGADDIMLNYQSTSFHDALYLRQLLKLRPAPEFEDWLIKMNLWNPETLQIGSSALLLQGVLP
ncbi:MAG: ethanolamine ammonia-lyase subunit EutB [Pseudobdellovibrionaceae bacterium]